MACLSPNKLADGTEAACRECKQCQLSRRTYWVGRNIAERKTSKFSYVITATYGRGSVGEVLHERAVVLTYSDCQKLLKLLRRHGYEVRFFITGEYGSEKQRAHWNIIIYSQQPLPAFAGWDQYGKWTDKARYKQRFNWVRTDDNGQPVILQNGDPAWWWPHGFVHIDQVTIPSVNYVCKYVLKDFDGNGRQGHKGQSKDPPIGTKWFQELAEKYVEQGLAPQTGEYRHTEAKTKKGEPIRFFLKARPLEMFLQHYIDTWATTHPDRPRPKSDLVDLFERHGRVVNDENAMLIRQEFPRGESRQPMPTRHQVRQYLDQLPWDQALAAWQAEAAARREINQVHLDGIEDGEKRQRRRQELERLDLGKWDNLLHEWGRAWVFGEGIIIVDPDRAKSRNLGDGGPELVRQPNQPDLGVERLQRLDPLGPVGRYNRDHRKPAKGN